MVLMSRLFLSKITQWMTFTYFYIDYKDHCYFFDDFFFSIGAKILVVDCPSIE